MLFAVFVWHQCAAERMKDTTLGLSEVHWQSERSGKFLGSPTILRLDVDIILAAHDVFGWAPVELP